MLDYHTDSSCPQFNKKNDEEIDFSKFPEATNPPDFKFFSAGVLRIGSFDEEGNYVRLITDEQLEQVYTRDELSDERVSCTEDSYSVNGFSTLVEPPKISTSNTIIEGRGRIKAAMNREEEFIPVFIYDPLTKYVTAATLVGGLLENNPDVKNSKAPNTMMEWALTIRGLVELGPKHGGIAPDATSVTNKLKELKWTKRWPRKSDQTKLRQRIDKELKALRNGDSMVHRRKDAECNLWIRENYSGSTNYSLVCMDNKRYIRQIIFEKVFPSVKDGSDPVHIILHTKRHTSSDAIKNCAEFVKQFDKAYESIFEHVGIMQMRDPEISSFINSFSEEKIELLTTYSLQKRPYVIDGAIPQIEGFHNLNSKKLVSIKNYGKKKRKPGVKNGLQEQRQQQNPNETDTSVCLTQFIEVEKSLGVTA